MTLGEVPQGRIAWISDPHLDRPSRALTARFFRALRGKVDGVILTGDISNGGTVNYLRRVSSLVGPEITVWFILGNHDYYEWWMDDLEKEIRKLCQEVPNLRWLTEESYPIPFPEGEDARCLVGTETWWDGGYTGYYTTWLDDLVMWKDHTLIKDLGSRSRRDRKRYLDQLSYLCAARAARKVEAAWRDWGYQEVVLAVHVPPFQESCPGWSPNWLTHFCSRALGDELLRVAKRNPGKTLRVLAGHTHRPVRFSPLPNLHVEVAEVRSGHPSVVRMV